MYPGPGFVSHSIVEGEIRKLDQTYTVSEGGRRLGRGRKAWFRKPEAPMDPFLEGSFLRRKGEGWREKLLGNGSPHKKS